MRLLTDPLWKLQCRLNRRLPFSAPARAAAEFVASASSTDPRTGAPPQVREPELAVVITTHARVECCRSLIGSLHESIHECALDERVFVIVLEDPSDSDYGPVLEALEQCFPNRFAFLTASRRLAKTGRWYSYQVAFDAIEALQPSRTLFLEDDAVLSSPTFVRDALARWDEIDDPRKVVLYLCRFDDDEPDGRWVRFRRTSLPGGRVQLTQWFDLHAFLVGRRFFECLGYTMFRPWASRWKGAPARSSGVSEQFTRRLWRRGNIYQVCQTLAFHGQAPSVLNVEARSVRRLDNHPRAGRT